MNTRNGTTSNSPFTLVSAYDPKQGKLISVSQPEAKVAISTKRRKAKVSAAESKKPSKAATNGAIPISPSEPTDSPRIVKATITKLRRAGKNRKIAYTLTYIDNGEPITASSTSIQLWASLMPYWDVDKVDDGDHDVDIPCEYNVTTKHIYNIPAKLNTVGNPAPQTINTPTPTPSQPDPTPEQPTIGDDELLMITNLRKLNIERQDAAKLLIDHLANPREQSEPADPEPAKETPAPEADDDSEDVFQPYHMQTDERHIRYAWAVYGALVGAAPIETPKGTVSRWDDNADCAITIIADVLAQHGV